MAALSAPSTISSLTISTTRFGSLRLDLADSLGRGQGISILPIQGITGFTDSDVVIGKPRGHLPGSAV